MGVFDKWFMPQNSDVRSNLGNVPVSSFGIGTSAQYTSQDSYTYSPVITKKTSTTYAPYTYEVYAPVITSNSKGASVNPSWSGTQTIPVSLQDTITSRPTTEQSASQKSSSDSMLTLLLMAGVGVIALGMLKGVIK